jgi:hypothetical protein
MGLARYLDWRRLSDKFTVDLAPGSKTTVTTVIDLKDTSVLNTAASHLSAYHDHPLEAVNLSRDWTCDGGLEVGGCRRGLTEGVSHNNLKVPRYRCSRGCDYDLCDQCLVSTLLSPVAATPAAASTEKASSMQVDVVNYPHIAAAVTSTDATAKTDEVVICLHLAPLEHLNYVRDLQSAIHHFNAEMSQFVPSVSRYWALSSSRRPAFMATVRLIIFFFSLCLANT